MYSLIAENKAKIEELCRKYHVERLDLVGSAAREDFDPERSDLDFLVTFRPGERKRFGDIYFSFLHELEDLFDRKVDLVEETAVDNPYLKRIFDRTKVNLYAA